MCMSSSSNKFCLDKVVYLVQLADDMIKSAGKAPGDMRSILADAVSDIMATITFYDVEKAENSVRGRNFFDL